jgi:hypothetical protein
MTLEETKEKITTLQHLIGQKAPSWNSTILEIIPAPIGNYFSEYMQLYKETGSTDKAMPTAKFGEFNILLIFRKPPQHLDLVCEWYSFFY